MRRVLKQRPWGNPEQPNAGGKEAAGSDVLEVQTYCCTALTVVCIKMHRGVDDILTACRGLVRLTVQRGDRDRCALLAGTDAWDFEGQARVRSDV